LRVLGISEHCLYAAVICKIIVLYVEIRIAADNIQYCLSRPLLRSAGEIGRIVAVFLQVGTFDRQLRHIDVSAGAYLAGEINGNVSHPGKVSMKLQGGIEITDCPFIVGNGYTLAAVYSLESVQFASGDIRPGLAVHWHPGQIVCKRP